MRVDVYENLDNFRLAIHGDDPEQQWASHVLPEFPEYEIFWRRYIVPLTNRIDPLVSRCHDPQLWLDLRPSVSERHEQMAMHHYSIFYYLARATQRIRSDKANFPEDVFCLLDACGDNVDAFFKNIRSILRDFDTRADFLPARKNQFCRDQDCSKDEKARGAFVEVQAYRDTILHNPVLGQVRSESRLWLPRRAYLDEVKLSWRNVRGLKPEQWVDSQELYSRLHAEVTSFLQEKWEKLRGTLDALRGGGKFEKQWAIDQRFLPIAPPEVAGSTSNHFVVSSSTSFQATSFSPTAAAAVAPSRPLNEPKAKK